MAWTDFVNGTTADADEVNVNFDESRNIVIAEAGEAITIGKACYIKESDGKAYISDSSSAIFFTGIAYAGVDSGADVTLVTSGLWITTGLSDKEIYYLGSSGAISTTVSAIRIGSADGTTDLYIDTSLSNQGAHPAPKLTSDATGGTADATTTETQVAEVQIPANTAVSGILCIATLTNTVGNVNDVTSTFKLYSGTNAAFGSNIERESVPMEVQPSNGYGYTNVGSLCFTVITDLTSAQYIHITCTNSSDAVSVSGSCLNLSTIAL